MGREGVWLDQPPDEPGGCCELARVREELFPDSDFQVWPKPLDSDARRPISRLKW